MGKYSTDKITVTLPKKLLKKLNSVKDYPRWKGNRSAVITEALENLFWEETKRLME